MSSKISALTSATTWADADLLTGVQGGVNKKLTRPVLLAAGAGVANALVQAGLSGGYDASGNFLISVASGAQFGVYQNFVQMLGLSAGGNWTVAPGGGAFTLNCGGSSVFSISAAGAIAITPASGQTVVIGGFAGSSSDWSGDPTDVWSAIYRIAAAVAAGTAGPIA